MSPPVDSLEEDAPVSLLTCSTHVQTFININAAQKAISMAHACSSSAEGEITEQEPSNSKLSELWVCCVCDKIQNEKQQAAVYTASFSEEQLKPRQNEAATLKH